MKTLTVLCIAVVGAAVATGWQEPVKLNGYINSGAGEWGTSISPDGTTLYFSSFRSGYMDIYVSHKAGGDWGPAQLVGPGNISTPAFENDPYIHWDDTTLYFVTERAGSWDIWYSKFAGGWTPAQPVPGAVNTSKHDEFNLCITPDGRTMYFSSDRPGAPGYWNIWASAWLGAAWGEPRPLGPPINSGFDDYAPKLSPDGRFMYFTSTRGDNYDIWVAEWSGSSWRNATKLGTPSNSTSLEFDPSVYVAGGGAGTLYFVSYREAPAEIWSADFSGGLSVAPASLGRVKALFR